MSLSVGMVTTDCADPQSLAQFWTAALGIDVVADYGDYMMLGGQPALGLQRVPESPIGKNRVHLDLRTDGRAGEVRRLTGLGATVVEEHEIPGLVWTVLTDPDGNEFCVGTHE